MSLVNFCIQFIQHDSYIHKYISSLTSMTFIVSNIRLQTIYLFAHLLTKLQSRAVSGVHSSYLQLLLPKDRQKHL